MEVVNLDPQQNQIGLRGNCPHCSRPSYFQPVTSAYFEALGSGPGRICIATQCQNCQSYVLAVAKRPGSGSPYVYEAHYPVGKPNDSVDAAVPQEIGKDFAQALRCRWVYAFRATAGMCRRALQASCRDLGAKGAKLIEEIDDLAAHGKITAALKEMAHQVRVIGNVGAHPDKDGLEDVEEQDADDVIEFVREFFNHVYVMPAKLAAIKARHSGAGASATTSS